MLKRIHNFSKLVFLQRGEGHNARQTWRALCATHMRGELFDRTNNTKRGGKSGMKATKPRQNQALNGFLIVIIVVGIVVRGDLIEPVRVAETKHANDDERLVRCTRRREHTLAGTRQYRAVLGVPPGIKVIAEMMKKGTMRVVSFWMVAMMPRTRKMLPSRNSANAAHIVLRCLRHCGPAQQRLQTSQSDQKYPNNSECGCRTLRNVL